MREAPTWDLVLKRNSIERLKREKFPLAIVDELPSLIERGYEEISEDDIVRLQWYGLYHDKPKVGYFMMRIKIPSGILTPHQFRTIGALSEKFGRGDAELSTRQNVQLHWIELRHLPEVFATLDGANLTTVGGCGDCVRNITGCPVAGINPDEVFDCTSLIAEAAAFFYGHPVYSDLPRKHKITISTCAHQCNAPAINCISLIGTRRDDDGSGRLGYALRLGGGLSTVPRISQHIGVFIPKDEAMEVLRAILDAWRENLRYRASRVKARLKFMMDDYGPEGFRQEIESRLGRRLEDLPQPPVAIGETDHLGIHSQKQPGLTYVGFPVYAGKIRGSQMMEIADIAQSVGGDIRLTRQQNFIIANVPNEAVDRVIAEVEEVGFSLKVNGIRGSSIGCTGQPLCNYAVAATKSKLEEIVEHLEEVFGREVEGFRVNVDGCPHACAQHFTGDIGLQGTTLRERGEGGEKLEGYDIFLRGSLGADAAIGRPVLRRIPSEQVRFYVERLVRMYLSNRLPNESPKAFWDRHSDEDLTAVASGETAPVAVSAASPGVRGSE